MVNCLSIISRAEFNNLYKFGHLYVHNIVPFEGKLSEHIDDKYLFDAVTAYMNTYEYSTEYILLHVCKLPFSGSSVEIFVKDVVGVYALDEEARASLAVSLDSRIVIQVSAWKSFFVDLNKKQAIRQARAGEYNCFEIFKISYEDRIKVATLLPEGFVEELFSDLYSHVRPSGNRSIWNYLIRYERHNPYWNDNRGFFSDAIHVYENYSHKGEIDYEIADEVALANVIGSSGTKFSEIYKLLKQKQGNDYQINGCSYFGVAPLYLYLKSCFKEGGITPTSFYSNEYLCNGDYYKFFGFDFAVAVSLLGISLGHDLTYSCYYEIMNIGIFNHILESRITTKIQIPKTVDCVDSQENQNELFSEVKRSQEDLSAEEGGAKDIDAPNETHKETLEDETSPLATDNNPKQEQLDESVLVSKTQEGDVGQNQSDGEDCKFPQHYDQPTQADNLVDSVEKEAYGSETESVEQVENEILSRKFPIKMVMPYKKRKGFKEIWAHDEEEYQEYLNKGYKPERGLDL